MKIFVLEDEIDFYPRNQIRTALAQHEVTYAKNVKEAKEKWGKGDYNLLLLDHDMEGFFEDIDAPNTGSEFVRWLLENHLEDLKKFNPEVAVHSQNPTGANNMVLKFGDHEIAAAWFPFGPAYVKALNNIARA